MRHLIDLDDVGSVEIVVAVSAENCDGFDDRTVWAVRENARVIGLDDADFGDVES